MRLYKYRSFTNLQFVLDIILNQRLYCSTYSSLSDPFEGLFLTTFHVQSIPLGITKILSPKSIEGLAFNSVDRIRLCSLSSSMSEVRMWSHYADGYKGVVFEIDFSDLESNTYKINYSDTLPSFGFSLLAQPCPREVLCCKTKHWEYESEYRIIQEESQYFEIINRIKAVYLGFRIDEIHYRLLDKIVPNEIPIYKTNINKHKIEVEIKEKIQR
jgi:hypothetical protein